MEGEWRRLSFREAGVTLIDCDHRTPQPAESGDTPKIHIHQYLTEKRRELMEYGVLKQQGRTLKTIQESAEAG